MSRRSDDRGPAVAVNDAVPALGVATASDQEPLDHDSPDHEPLDHEPLDHEPPNQAHVEILRAAARALAESAATIRDVQRAATESAFHSIGLRSALRSPGTAVPALRALVRAITNRRGLGWAFTGGAAGTCGYVLGLWLNRYGLATDVAVRGLRLRVHIAGLTHPELEEGPMARLQTAIEHDHQIRQLRIMRGMKRDGVDRLAQLTVAAPVFADLLSWNALLDENPFNDRGAWPIATGGVADVEPLFGIPISFWALFDRGPGRAEQVAVDRDLASRLATATGIAAFVRNIAVISGEGRILIQRVACADGATRHVVQLTGLTPGKVRPEHPQNLSGGFTSVGRLDTAYTRAVVKAIEAARLPRGSELLLVGHSQGGATAASLACHEELALRYRITHVVGIGAPLDFKRPVDPRTVVVSLVNEHDLVPALDGRSGVSPFDLPEGWTEITWHNDTHSFPLCHAAEIYAEDLETIAGAARDEVDAIIERYRGTATESLVFELYDR